MKQHSSFSKSRKLSGKGAKPELREEMSELVVQLRNQLNAKRIAAPEEYDEGVADEEKPNLDRLTVGVDLGDQRSNYCILGLGGETLRRASSRRVHRQ